VKLQKLAGAGLVSLLSAAGVAIVAAASPAAAAREEIASDATTDEERFDSDIYEAADREAARRRAACPQDMIAVEGDYCPYIFQHCVKYKDPATEL